MQNASTTESLGARIIAAARMAVELHLQLDEKATIGGTDRDVTEDKILSVVSGQLSVDGSQQPPRLTTDN
jgi:hypothetical protein